VAAADLLHDAAALPSIEPDKPIVDAVDSLRAELARLFNMPEDSAAAGVPAFDPPSDPIEAAALAIFPDAAPPDSSDDEDEWRAQLRSLVGPSPAEAAALLAPSEPESVPPAPELPPVPEAHAPPEQRPKKEEDTIAAYMERLLARTRGTSAGGSWSQASRSTDELRHHKPIAPADPTTNDEAADSAGAAPTNFLTDEDDLSYLEAAPTHQQDKDHVREKLQSFRHVANLSARTALAKYGWRSKRGEIAAQSLLAAVSFAGAAAFYSGPLWGGAVRWWHGAGCLVAAGWMSHLWWMSVHRLWRLNGEHKRQSAIAESPSESASDAEAAPELSDVTAAAQAPPESAASSPVE
jgi:hypothetical protein